MVGSHAVGNADRHALDVDADLGAAALRLRLLDHCRNEGRRVVRFHPFARFPAPGVELLRQDIVPARDIRSEEHTSELQSLMRTSYAVFCLKKKKPRTSNIQETRAEYRKENEHQPIL